MSDSEQVQPASTLLQEQTPETPKRRGRPPGSKNKTGSKRRGRRKNLEEQIGGTLTMLNLAFMFAPDDFRGDALDEVEISALAKTLNDAAKENDQLYGWLDAALGGTGSAMLSLGVVAAAIAARRMARHGIIVSAEWDDRIGAFVAMNAGEVNGIDFAQMFDAAATNAEAMTDTKGSDG